MKKKFQNICVGGLKLGLSHRIDNQKNAKISLDLQLRTLKCGTYYTTNFFFQKNYEL